MVRTTMVHNKRGVTVIELIIALSLAAMLISSVYYFWNYLNRHTNTHTQKALFTTETHRIAHSIADQIRNASSILSYDIASITFVSSKNDTMNYSFDGDSLLLNEKPITLISHNARVSDFTITNLTEGDYRESQHSLIELSLTMLDNLGDTSSVALTIRAPRPSEVYDEW